MLTNADDFPRKPVNPPKLHNNMSVRELVNVWGKAGAFNGGRLAEACTLFERMLRDDCFVGVSVAGAMIPAGMGGILCDMIERGQVDIVVTTGANLYHDIHMALGMPFYKGTFDVDDEYLRKRRLDRVYDVWVSEDALIEFDNIICDKVLPEVAEDFSYGSTAEFNYALGRVIHGITKHPDQSVIAKAYEHKVPIFCPSPADSSIGMDLAKYNIVMKPRKLIKIDPDKDVIQSAGLTMLYEKIGGLVMGGGAPKNFLLQTQPMLEQILGILDKGYDWLIQLSVDAPHYGGLSGATPSEAISWGKVKLGRKDNLVVVYGDATMTLPILSAFAAPLRRRPRKLLERLSEAEAILVKGGYGRKPTQPQ